MPSLSCRPFGAVTLLAGLLTAGCGGPKTYPVEGKVVYTDGSPAKELAGGLVEFDAAEAGVSARGDIEADGTFRMSTYQPNDGCLPGKFRALIMPPASQDVDRPLPPVIDKRYQGFDTSGLEVEVKPEKNQVTLTVERLRGPRR